MDPTGIDVIVAVVKDLGFPAFVAVFLLVRQARLTSELTAAIISLKQIIELKLGGG